jgi:hypothetical protein
VEVQQPKERLGPIGAVVVGLVLSGILGFFLLLFIGLYAFPFFLVFLFAFLVYALYEPKPEPGVSVVISATPSRKVYDLGNPKGSYKEKKYRLAGSKPARLSLKAYVHGKSNRNVLITGSSGQGKSKLTRYLLSHMLYQKLVFSFKAGEEYLKMG